MGKVGEKQETERETIKGQKKKEKEKTGQVLGEKFNLDQG